MQTRPLETKEEELQLINRHAERLKQIEANKTNYKTDRGHNIKVMNAIIGDFQDFEQKESRTDSNIIQNIRTLIDNSTIALNDKRLNSCSDHEIFAEKNCMKSSLEMLNHQNDQAYVNDLFDKIMELESARHENPPPADPDVSFISPERAWQTTAFVVPISFSSALAYGVYTGFIGDNYSQETAIGGAIGLGAFFLAITGITSWCCFNELHSKIDSVQQKWEKDKKICEENKTNRETSAALLQSFSLLAKKVAKNIPHERELGEIVIETNTARAKMG